MATKYNSLEEMRRKKELVKAEINDMESLLTFENPKQSLSLITDGFTDNFLTEKTTSTGETQLSIQTGNIAREVGQRLFSNSNPNAMVHLDHSGLQDEIVSNSLKIGGAKLATEGVSYIRNLAKNHMKSKNWRDKLIGLALVYVLPMVLKSLRQQLESYQRRQSLSSMHKII